MDPYPLLTRRPVSLAMGPREERDMTSSHSSRSPAALLYDAPCRRSSAESSAVGTRVEIVRPPELTWLGRDIRTCPRHEPGDGFHRGRSTKIGPEQQMACHCGEVVPCMLTKSRDVRSRRGCVVGEESLGCGLRLDAPKALVRGAPTWRHSTACATR